MSPPFAEQFRATLEAQEIPVECPACRTRTPKSIGWMLANTKLQCPGCSVLIELDNRKLVAAFGNIDATAQKLEDSLAKAARLLEGKE